MIATASSQLSDSTLTLNDLSERSVSELSELYQQASMSATMNKLDGHPKGRMLAIKGADSAPVARVIRMISKASLFPWGGKSFKSTNKKEGSGINRINLTLFQQNWFPFKTVVEPSAIDGKQCIYLDYDLAGNPWFIRRIRDELREVSAGLFLGPAMWKKKKGGATLLLWFAIDTRN
jgi:hypothetical protein